MRQSRVSPTLSELSNAFENFSVEALCKIVGQLVGCGDLEHFNTSIVKVLPEEVLLDQGGLGPAGDTLLGSKQQCPILVLKDMAMNGILEVRWQDQFLATRFHKEGHGVAIESSCLH